MKRTLIVLVVALFVAPALHAQWYYEGVLLRAHETPAAASADAAGLDPVQQQNAEIIPLRYRVMPLYSNTTVVTWALAWQPSQYDDVSCLGAMPGPIAPLKQFSSGDCTTRIGDPYFTVNFTSFAAAKSYFDTLGADVKVRSCGVRVTPVGTWLVDVPSLSQSCP
jgi:hypothetical protein